MTFIKLTQTITLSPIGLAAPAAKPVLISNLQLKKTLRKKNGSPVFVAVVTEDLPNSKLEQELDKQKVSDSIKVLLREFSDVFPDDLPIGLPPE